MIKCVLFKAHCTVIANVIEIDAELGNPNCKLINPYVIDSSNELIPWKADITNQTEFMIRSEDILTIADPNGTILDKYTELTA